jgi:hypothetical protein
MSKSAVLSGSRFHAELMRNKDQFRCVIFKGIRQCCDNNGAASVHLAARIFGAHSGRSAILHGTATGGPRICIARQQAGGGRHRGPKDHHRQQQKRAFSANRHSFQITIYIVSMNQLSGYDGDLNHTLLGRNNSLRLCAQPFCCRETVSERASGHGGLDIGPLRCPNLQPIETTGNRLPFGRSRSRHVTNLADQMALHLLVLQDLGLPFKEGVETWNNNQGEQS